MMNLDIIQYFQASDQPLYCQMSFYIFLLHSNTTQTLLTPLFLFPILSFQEWQTSPISSTQQSISIFPIYSEFHIMSFQSYL
jgi:hypothetical protein